MGEHLWHRVSEHGQPPFHRNVMWRIDENSDATSWEGEALTAPAEWCVVDLPTEYAPKPLRNGWRAMSTCPCDGATRVLVQWPDGIDAYTFSGARDLAGCSGQAWMPLPAGPYDEEPQGAPE